MTPSIERAGFRQPAQPLDGAGGTPRSWLYYLRIVLLLCLAQVLQWGLAVALGYRAPDVDSAEQFVWAVSLEPGYFKHPPLPSWIMHGLLQAFGPSLVLPVVAAQLCVTAALALTWRLGCEFMSPRRSLIATALTSLITYHNIGADSFNHNTVLLPFQAATLLLFYLATRRGEWLLWALTGLFAGLSVLVKYVALAPLAGMLLYFALDRALHRRRALLGLLLATVVFALVLLPHVRWLLSVDFQPFRYAQLVATKLPDALPPLANVADFILTQLQRSALFLLALGYLLAGSRGAHGAEHSAAAPALPRRDRLFVWSAALSPLAMIVAIGLFGGTALAGRWGANAFLLSGHVALLLVRRNDSQALLCKTLCVVLPAQVLLCAAQTFGKTTGADWIALPTRPNFPGALLAAEARDTWRLHAGDRPLRLVASDSWLGGNLIVQAGRQPLQVLIDGSRLRAPWVAPDAIAGCGALVLEDVTHDRHTPAQPHPELDALLVRAEFTGVWTLPWAGPWLRAAAGPRGLIRWGIILPKPGARCVIGAGSGNGTTAADRHARLP